MEINLLIVMFSSMAALSFSACPKSHGDCFPTPTRKTCVTDVQNGTGLNWFQMQRICGQHSGRLVWLIGPFNVISLSASDHKHLLKDFDTVATGLIGSVKTLMWANPNSSVCGSELTNVCALHLENEIDCSALGCCMSNGKCHYPEHENVTTYNESGPIEGLKTTERKCIGMIKVNNSFTKPNWTAFNCSEPIPGHAGFVCEYKCEDQWPDMANEYIVWPTTAIKSPSTNNRGTSLCSKDWAMQAVFSISYLIILYNQIC